MFAANTYLIRPTIDQDATSLSQLAGFDSHEPLTGQVLIGHIGADPVAAISVASGRIIADPARSTGHLLACLRVRAGALRAYEATPSLRTRMLDGVAPRAAEPIPRLLHPERAPKRDRFTTVSAADARREQELVATRD